MLEMFSYEIMNPFVSAIKRLMSYGILIILKQIVFFLSGFFSIPNSI